MCFTPRWHQGCVQSLFPVLAFVPCSSNDTLSQFESQGSMSSEVCECANQVSFPGSSRHFATQASMAGSGQTRGVIDLTVFPLGFNSLSLHFGFRSVFALCFTSGMASEMCPKPCSSLDFQVIFQQWPHEPILSFRPQCLPRCVNQVLPLVPRIIIFAT